MSTTRDSTVSPVLSRSASPSRSPALSNLLNDPDTTASAPIFSETRPRKRQRSNSPSSTLTTSNGHAIHQQFIPLEPSYFGVTPHDDFTREVGNWLWGWCKGRQNVEIEAKVGILLDTMVPKHEPPRRFYCPVANECIITDPNLCRFESNMTVRQHAGFNALLNSRVEEQAFPSYVGPRIKHQRTREIDYFHSAPGGKKVRVTMILNRDNTITPKPNGIIEKERIANMNVYSPKQGFDFRISVSAENPLPVPPSNRPTAERFKDRISYSHQILQVDLTSVEARDPTPSKKAEEKKPLSISYELEVEFKDVQQLMREGAKQAATGDEEIPNTYYEQVQIFLNTVRMLIKNAEDP